MPALNNAPPLYRGRFAPSPTGPLHFGSLIAAVGSFLDARARGGEWLLRMEDIDAPRCSMAAAEDILRTLEIFGLVWDDAVVWQHQRQAAYADALAQLQKNMQVFPCACTRRELADSLLAADGAVIYPGTCRLGIPEGKKAQAWRLRVGQASMSTAPIVFEDAIQGRIKSDLSRDAGDFIVRRADGVFAYQLAVVVDDAAAGITHVVRGTDLLLSTPRQIFLQQCLGLPAPLYAHLPVAVNEAGEKLSKQTLATPLDVTRPVPALISALALLGQKPPAELADASLDELWMWAICHWRLENVPRQRVLPAPLMA
ncbi:MAG: tRNA glutamyl-Q(34) synthetase GluQRS [Rugosibacter sp.]|nr:tRNA glutamyl-Q(34) synthetase GluQRS [Rugosibacter sp.]